MKRYRTLADYLADGHTQAELAASLTPPVDQTVISRALRGKGSFAVLSRIAEYTGVPLESFRPARVEPLRVPGVFARPKADRRQAERRGRVGL